MRVSLVLLLCIAASAGRASAAAGDHPVDESMASVPWTAEEIVALCDGTDDGLPW
jgi:hypothetical protein